MNTLSALAVLIAGAIGGLAFGLLHIPLPWTLGAMFAAALLSSAWPRLVLPGVFRDGARPVIGVLAGSAFSPAVVEGMTAWWPMILFLAGFFLIVIVSGNLFFRARGFDRPTAFYASMPGGLGEMTLLGDAAGADLRRLVLVHSVRIVVVVTTVPFLLRLITGSELMAPDAAGSGHLAPEAADWAILVACAGLGYLLGRPLRAFGGGMIMAMLLSAVAHGSGITAAAPPTWLIAAMQVVIGCITGARFVGTNLAEARKALWQGLSWSAILISMSLAAAMLAADFFPIGEAALFLALSPGGFAEMTVIALAAGVEVAFVVSCHAFRTICIVMVAPMLYRLSLRASGQP